MAEKQKKAVFGSLQPDVDPLLELNDLTAADFAPATSGEKEDFIQQRKSVSYWADAWRRLRKNVVAMVALGVIVLLVLFAFVGPMLVPYGYDQFNAGAENLYPWHYSLEAQQAYKEATSSQDPDEAVAAAEAEAAARGEELSSKDKALIRAQAKAGGGAEYEGMSEEDTTRPWATPPSPSATPTTSCSASPTARRCSPMCSAPTATAAISWCAPCLPPECP